MYANKKNVLQLASLLLQYNVTDIVVSPGSRNAPLIHTFAKHPKFKCYTVVDERSAAFFAFGMVQRLERPVVLCCTSGTALLNYAPALAEAGFQNYPLLVVSADRPQAWIGQMDGQTLVQPGVFNSLVKKSVQLPEVNTPEEEWYCNRLINEAMMALWWRGFGPVHINIPISEPLFDFSVEELPAQRHLDFHNTEYPAMAYNDPLRKSWEQASKRMIIVGQAYYTPAVRKILQTIASQKQCVILAEHPANLPEANIIHNFDAVLYSLSEEEKKAFAPDVLISIGGHITSKRLKELIRKYPAKTHWYLGQDGRVPDTFQCLTDIIEIHPGFMLRDVLQEPVRKDFHYTEEEMINSRQFDWYQDKTPYDHSPYALTWHERSQRTEAIIQKGASKLPFSDALALKYFMDSLPPSTLHLANSTIVRNAQLFPLGDDITIRSNRGTSGIEGCLSTAAGYAAAVTSYSKSFLVIGDLSYMYDYNILLNGPLPSNLRVMVIHNDGGEIFRMLPGLKDADTLDKYICQTNPKRDLTQFGIVYKGRSKQMLKNTIHRFVNSKMKDAPQILHVFTSSKENVEAIRNLYHLLKKKENEERLEND